MRNIKIGTLLRASVALEIMPKITPYGFECYSIFFEQSTDNYGPLDVPEYARKVKAMADDLGVEISCVTLFGNPLTGTGTCADSEASWKRLIDNACLFGTNLITGFTGRVEGLPVEGSIPRFKQVFGELVNRAEDKGVRLAFENCQMGGTWRSGEWNIAFNPAAWELMFDAVPSKSLGLEWEPCHQMTALIDPLPQLRDWCEKGRIFHIHGKDCTLDWDIIRRYGIYGPKEFAYHRTPGFGDTDWVKLISILRAHGYEGTIDIEGYHDPVYRDAWEWTGQVHGLNYLKRCRGGDYIPDPLAKQGE